MKKQWTHRTEMLLGREQVAFLKRCKVAVFGLGGVGSWAAEALVRCGIGNIVLIDHDTVDITNLNRQLQTNLGNVGQSKALCMRDRLLSINPKLVAEVREVFYMPDMSTNFFPEDWDYMVDAIDTVTAKLSIAEEAFQRGIPLISSMGTGNKLDPTRIRITDISKTTICPLARVMRIELKKRGINHLKVAFSDELPRKPIQADLTGAEASIANLTGAEATTQDTCATDKTTTKRLIPGSAVFVPAAAGLAMASEIIRDLLNRGFEKETT